MNLVIGKTSQLAHYFPDDYIKISSRNIDFEKYLKNKYDRIYICFAEQRTFIENSEEEFINVNYNYTIDIINKFKNNCNNIIFYSTCELWNNCEGGITLDMPYNYNYSPYIKSKELITNYIKNNFDNVIIVYPFNFNSPYRKSGFLFSKIFDSIINNKKIEIGDTNFYRDITHPKQIVNESIKTNKDKLIGTGKAINIRDFIVDLYSNMDMDFNEYVTENNNFNLSVKRKTFWKKSNIIYNNLLQETIDDIKKIKK